MRKKKKLSCLRLNGGNSEVMQPWYSSFIVYDQFLFIFTINVIIQKLRFSELFLSHKSTVYENIQYINGRDMLRALFTDMHTYIVLKGPSLSQYLILLIL